MLGYRLERLLEKYLKAVLGELVDAVVKEKFKPWCQWGLARPGGGANPKKQMSTDPGLLVLSSCYAIYKPNPLYLYL